MRRASLAGRARTLTHVDVPIACGLAEPAARSQFDEWRDLLRTVVTATDRRSPTVVAFRLGDTSALSGLVELAQRELACCPFLDFSVRIEPHDAWLELSAPPEAAEVLDAFASLTG